MHLALISTSRKIWKIIMLLQNTQRLWCQKLLNRHDDEATLLHWISQGINKSGYPSYFFLVSSLISTQGTVYKQKQTNKKQTKLLSPGHLVQVCTLCCLSPRWISKMTLAMASTLPMFATFFQTHLKSMMVSLESDPFPNELLD